MKYTLLICITFIFNKILISQVYVNGYYKSNGTYVSPHYRTYPDGNKYNNFSSNRKSALSYPSSTGTSITFPSLNNSIYSNSMSESEIKALTERSKKIQEESDAEINALIERMNKTQEAEKKIYVEKTLKSEFEFDRDKVAGRAVIGLPTNLATIDYINNMSYEDLISWHLRYSKEKKIFLEKSLNLLGYDIGRNDGFFDYYTIKGIKSFQIANDLEIDGKIGQKMIDRIKYLVFQK